LRPSKEDLLKVQDSSPLSLRVLMGPRLKGCGCLAYKDAKFLHVAKVGWQFV